MGKDFTNEEKCIVKDLLEFITHLEWDLHVIETQEVPMGECDIEFWVIKHQPKEISLLMDLIKQVKEKGLVNLRRDGGVYWLMGTEKFANINEAIYN